MLNTWAHKMCVLYIIFININKGRLDLTQLWLCWFWLCHLWFENYHFTHKRCPPLGLYNSLLSKKTRVNVSFAFFYDSFLPTVNIKKHLTKNLEKAQSWITRLVPIKIRQTLCYYQNRTEKSFIFFWRTNSFEVEFHASREHNYDGWFTANYKLVLFIPQELP